MGLVSMKELLADAEEKQYAVGGFNLVDLQFLEAVLDAAQEVRSPVILAIAEVHFPYVDLESLAKVIHHSVSKLPVPVAIHLDHGKTLQAIMRAIRSGFTSVMFDGSMLPFEENIDMTKEIVKFARAVGVTVEAELGHVTGSEGGMTPTASDPSLMTDPMQAAEFARRTGADALAISIGNVHGLYQGEPHLDFERLKQIRELTGVPVVLHGGSGISDEDFRHAIRLGVRKINIFTEMQISATEAMKATFSAKGARTAYMDLMVASKQGVREVATQKMNVFGSASRCCEENPLCSSCKSCELGESDSKLIQLIAEVTASVLKESRQQ